MRWEDTLKGYRELKKFCAQKGILNADELDLREAQAQISFEAGRKEMAEEIAKWIEKEGHRVGVYFELPDFGWEVQKKIWGINWQGTDLQGK